MELNSLVFILASSVAVFFYYLLNPRYRILFLILLSCGFIATYSYKLLAYIIVFTIINYIIGLGIPNVKRKKTLFTFGILLNISQLVLLKYVDFTIEPVLRLFNIESDLTSIARFIVPIGVSYFTLQGIGYLVNINFKWEKPEKKFHHFLLYMIFYPRFIAGPIDRSNLFLPQIKEHKNFDFENIKEGANLVLYGLFKKVVVANQLYLIVNGAYGSLNSPDNHNLLLVVLLQPLYLYFDFSGYTDIAIGFARAFGIKIPINFNRPFMAQNVSNFWKRFHASLSSWFNDFVFMRTMFRYRKYKKHATTIALFLTWILFGIWHGAGWNFMFLGLLQALAIYYEYSSKRWRNRMFSLLPKILRTWSGRFFTYMFYSISLVFFFAPDLKSAFLMFSTLPSSTILMPADLQLTNLLIIVLSILFVMVREVIEEDYQKLSNRIISVWQSNRRIAFAFRWLVYYGCIIMLMAFSQTETNEFVYFQF